MEREIFDKETLLDLTVNFIPLGIILFFIVGFTVWAPWGFGVRGFAPMMVIMVTMFIALAVLTYISGKAIAGDEKTKPVYPQGQAGLEGAKTVHEIEAEIEAEENGKPTAQEAEAAAASAETDTDESDAAEDAAAESDAEDAESEADDTEATETKQPADGDDEPTDASK